MGVLIKKQLVSGSIFLRWFDPMDRRDACSAEVAERKHSLHEMGASTHLFRSTRRRLEPRSRRSRRFPTVLAPSSRPYAAQAAWQLSPLPDAPCLLFATLLTNAPERCVRCRGRGHGRESRQRAHHVRASNVGTRAGVHERCDEASADSGAVCRSSGHLMAAEWSRKK